MLIKRNMGAESHVEGANTRFLHENTHNSLVFKNANNHNQITTFSTRY
jgi:hypothetical protein